MDTQYELTTCSIQPIYYPMTGDCVKFSIKAAGDAYVEFIRHKSDGSETVHVIFGSHDNTTCSILLNGTYPLVAVSPANPNGFISPKEFREFWIRYRDEVFYVGRGGEKDSFLKWKSTQPFPIGFYSVATYPPNIGKWLVNVPLHPHNEWIGVSGDEIPESALVAGHDLDGKEIYIARAYHGRELLPGKAVRTHRNAYVSWGGHEHTKDTYQVLTNVSYDKWCKVNPDGTLPKGAIVGGKTGSGEKLYIGRARHNDTLTTGRVEPSHGGVCYIPFNKNEIRCREYEVLVDAVMNEE